MFSISRALVTVAQIPTRFSYDAKLKKDLHFDIISLIRSSYNSLFVSKMSNSYNEIHYCKQILVKISLKQHFSDHDYRAPASILDL